MKMTFKQFSDFMDTPDEELTEERIDEIFGLDKLLAAAKAIIDPVAREKRIKELEDEKAAAAKAAWAKRQDIKKTQQTRAASVATQTAKTPVKAYDADSVVGARAAGAQAAERDWANDARNE
jgi:hypothetical protein